MPLHQEKKYHVDSFTEVEQKLTELGASKSGEVVTTHYYARLPTKNVVKLVHYSDRDEVHRLSESDGKFALTERIPVEDTKAGLQWLKNQSYTTVDLVKMANTDYAYKNGLVGLYVINDSLHSVILDFAAGDHEAIAKELGLENAEEITLPYNQYLASLGQLKSQKL